MKRNERIRDKFPIFAAYGSHQEFLTIDGAASATTEERIRSIWPFIVRRVLAFQKTLRPREAANFDAEDVAAELWIAVASKDHKWTPERGKYITFAGVIIEKALCTIREKSRTVQSPRNTSCRIKEYQSEADRGSISDGRRKTMADIRRTGDGIVSMSSGASTKDRGVSLALVDERSEDPLEAISGMESSDTNADAIAEAMKRLSEFEADVITSLHGLMGKPRISMWEISFTLYVDEDEVRRAARRATKKIRSYLLADGHPATRMA